MIASATGLSAESLASLGWEDSYWPQLADARWRRPAVRIPYRNAAGREISARYILHLVGDPERRFRWQPGAHATLYGQDCLAEARQLGFVLLVASELDQAACRLAGLPAVAVPAGYGWRSAYAACLVDIPRVYAWGREMGAAAAVDIPSLEVVEAPESVCALLRTMDGDLQHLRRHVLDLLQQASPYRHPLAGTELGGRVGAAEYTVHEGRLCLCQLSQGAHKACIPIVEGVVRIRRRLQRLYGEDEEGEPALELEAYLPSGRPLPPARIPAADFARPSRWVIAAWGGSLAIDFTRERHVSNAIMAISRPETGQVYAHLGWARTPHGMVYIHAGGGIDASGEVQGLEVDLPPELWSFRLPPPPEGDEERLAASQLLSLLDIAPERITAPLLLAALSAPLGGTPYSIALVGSSGQYKTSLACVFQSLWGTPLEPPASWDSTPNAIEALAWHAKEALLLVDDLWPEHVEGASRLFRSQANQRGRSRAGRAGQYQGERHPRGLLLITGEDLPAPRVSVQARVLVLSVGNGDIDSSRLRLAQLAASDRLLAGAMAAWIRWLASRFDELKAAWEKRRRDLRPSWQSLCHGRLTDLLSSLQATWELWLDYLRQVDILDESEVASLTQRIEDGLRQAAAYQNAEIQHVTPAEMFPGLLASLFLHDAHLRPAWAPESHLREERFGWECRPMPTGGMIWLPRGSCIGWAPHDPDRTGIYLDPIAAYARLAALASRSGVHLPSQRMFWTQLAEAGLIFKHCETDRARTVRRVEVPRRVGGVMRRVIHVLPHALIHACYDDAQQIDDGR